LKKPCGIDVVSNPDITAVIPARAGSKGIPGKNIWTYEGVTLLERAIRLGRNCKRVNRVIVSTDDAHMRELALVAGAECPALRPPHLANDTATSAAVVEHVLRESGVIAGHILLLQVTSPLRLLSDLDGFLDVYLAANAPAAVSVVKWDEPRPEKLKKIEAGKLVPYLGQNYEGPRQTLPQPYALNGAFYAIQRDVFLAKRSFLPDGTLAFEMPASRSHNLDGPQDLQILAAMLKAGHWHLEDLPDASK
jgi:CMP-N,N'-diacetyllegionaminic acid synthase